jgi:arginine deiminase
VRFQIDNEYDQLQAVMVHRPGLEIDRLTHENMRQYLFEDIPYLRRMQDEHDNFVETLRSHGVQVIYLRDLLIEVVRDDEARLKLIEDVCRAAIAPALAEDMAQLRYWDHDTLVDLLFAGLTNAEYGRFKGRSVGPGHGDDFLLPPIPNAYFSRDPAVVVRNAVISSKMHYPIRVRESLLVRSVLEYHPDYSDNPISYGGTDEPTEDRPYTIEGGDIIILSRDAVLIGASERTRSETIEKLAEKCFQYGHVKRLYEVPIPVERAFMHLDTVFTVVDRGTVLWFAPVMSQVRYVHRYVPVESDEEIVAQRVPEDRSFADILRDEFDSELTIIDTAGGHGAFAAREQRTDATNALAIAPRVVVAYERNERTLAALEEHGVTCLAIDDSELVRGLGGPRCMTMPLRRSAQP